MNRSPMPRPDRAKLRAWRERSKGLKPGAPPERRKAMARVNAARRRKSYARNFGERASNVRQMPCLVLVKWYWKAFSTLPPQCVGQSHAAHARARGMGGCKGDRRVLVPLCAEHHREAGEYGTTQRAEFEAKYGIDLMAEAGRIAVQFDQEGLP